MQMILQGINLIQLANRCAFLAIFAICVICRGDDGVANAQSAKQLAFPGAEGYGRFAKGGRGGDVYHVTNLNDSGPGSLREGIRLAHGPRTIVFDVSGTIELARDLRIENITCMTVAGQTAPGDGITLRKYPLKVLHASDIIVRYLRVRLGDENPKSDDCLDVVDSHDVILDHVTATWAIDGTMDTDNIANFTMQWCLFGEALNHSTHYKGSDHAMLMSFRKTRGNVSIHHNLLFSSRNRHPSLGGGNPSQLNPKAIFDFRNNVEYNWEGPCNLGQGQFNLINNYFRPGPNTKPEEFPIAPKAEAENQTIGFLSGNFFEGQAKWTADNFTAVAWGVRGGRYTANVPLEKFRLADEPVAPADRPLTHSPQRAYELVLESASASKVRDAADLRIVEGIRNRTHRRIDSQKEVGGWPNLKTLPAPLDTDGDGMPDDWERAHHLNPSDPSDRNAIGSGGFTNLEIYLNSLCAKDEK